LSAKDKHIITVYEHDCIKYDPHFYGKKITEEQFKALEKYHGSGTLYYSLVYKGVQFNAYVGVIQVGNLTIEVLPKIDRKNGDAYWRNILLNMLKRIGFINVSATSKSDLKLKSNSILDLYFELFLNEAESLLHKGLIKQYRKKEENISALKGSLNFAKQISKNIVHKEKFYVQYTTYDREHPLNKVIYKTLLLIQKINTNSTLQSKVGALLLNFPEMPGIFVDEAFFDTITYNRKTEVYKPAISISKLLLLQFHPAISSGKHHVLALMFDMNLLWERFVFVSLKKYLPNAIVTAQSAKPYYKLNGHKVVRLVPDIHVSTADGEYIIDTKWKLPANNKPAHADLQQMYAYTKYFNSTKTILCYPGVKDEIKEGGFYGEITPVEAYRCSVMTIGLESYGDNIGDWMKGIGERFGEVV